MTDTPFSPDNNRAAIAVGLNGVTLQGYEGCALDYAQSTAPTTGAQEGRALRKLLDTVDPNARVLEIGSGPGWDADWLEARGLQVRRTDATEAFVRFQNARGKPAERLNVLTDEPGGSHDAILALYVLQHIERQALPQVFRKLADALPPEGVFLFSIREGRGEIMERGSEGRSYYVALWQMPDLLAALEPLGFDLLWSESSEDAEGRWLTTLFRKTAQVGDTPVTRAA